MGAWCMVQRQLHSYQSCLIASVQWRAVPCREHSNTIKKCSLLSADSVFEFQERPHRGGHESRDVRFRLVEQFACRIPSMWAAGVNPLAERCPPAPEWLVIPPTARGGSDKPAIQPKAQTAAKTETNVRPDNLRRFIRFAKHPRPVSMGIPTAAVGVWWGNPEELLEPRKGEPHARIGFRIADGDGN
jgi:hypothetical protein